MRRDCCSAMPTGWQRAPTRRGCARSPARCAFSPSMRAPTAARAGRLAAHCRATLRPLAEGGFRLCCPREVESAIFQIHRDADTWQRLPAARAAIHLVSGDPALPDRGWVSACMPDMAAQLPRTRLTRLASTAHMMIFEQPDACRDLVLGAIGPGRSHAMKT